MTYLRFGLSRLAIGFVVSGTLALTASLGAGETAQAAPGFVSGLGNQASPVMDARIYRRGRTPIYPYYYNPGRPGGYSFFFGFVPYAKGDIENQAIQRGQYPQDIEWPPVGAAPPRPGWGPKADD
jgi:hypothetical protein